jgi:predicted O-methyltransferase YrrM
MQKIPNEVIFSVLRTLKGANPGDTYYENYLWHYNKRQESFFDIYHFSWAWSIEHKPRKILEIGVRTGISLCQLLSSYIDYSNIDRVVLCDVFNDGFISPELVKYNLKTLNIPVENKLEFLIGDSKQKVPEFATNNPGTLFDYVLVDGDHSPEGAIADLRNVRFLVAQGGVLVFDDISPDGMSLLPTWEQFKQECGEEFEWHEDLNGKGLGWGVKK